MRPWKSIVIHAKKSLIALGIVISLGLGLVLVSQKWMNSMQQSAALTQADKSSQQGVLEQKQADLGNIESHISQFRKLVDRGMVGNVEREAWVEQLVLSHQLTGLPQTLTYTLHPPKTLNAQVDSPSSSGTVTEGLPVAASNEAQFHDLEFSITNIHEEELVALTDNFARRVRGQFRINSCVLSNATESGLDAHCVLRFFTMGNSGTLPALLPSESAPKPAARPPTPPTPPRLGTFIYTPEERSSIARERTSAGDSTATGLEVTGVYGRLQINGLVKRDRGNSTAWINRKPIAEERTLPTGQSIGVSSTKVTIQGKSLKVGEALDINTLERDDILPKNMVTPKASY